MSREGGAHKRKGPLAPGISEFPLSSGTFAVLAEFESVVKTGTRF